MRLSFLWLVVASGCVAFDYEEELFSCASDEDCDSEAGYVCAGFTFADGELKSYCVTGGDREVVVQMKVASPFPPDNGSDACKPVDGTLVTAQLFFQAESADIDSLRPSDALPAPSDEEECVLDTSSFRGDAKAICTLAYDSAINTAAMGVAYTLGSTGTGQKVAWAYSKVALKKNVFSYDLGTVSVFDLDVPEDPLLDALDGSDRCTSRAAARVQVCGGTALTACSCTAGNDDLCPPFYYCATDNWCWQTGDRAAEESCSQVVAESCESGECVSQKCAE